MKAIPLGDNVIIRRRTTEEMASPTSVIHLPDTAKEKSQEGVVVAVGEGAVHPSIGTDPDSGLPIMLRVSLVVAPGDRVLFGKFAGSEIGIDGETYLIMRESEIQLILERGEEAGDGSENSL